MTTKIDCRILTINVLIGGSIVKTVPHLKLSDDISISYAILPGDPARVERVAKHMQQVEELSCNREFKSIKGIYKGLPILVTSTGIGGPSMAIAVEELSQIGVKNAIRIGSCGALQSTMHLGDLVLVQGAIRDEGTTKAYIDLSYPAIPDYDFLKACEYASNQYLYPVHIGMIRSHDSLYAEQKKKADDYYSQKNVLASDMETAALFVVGGLRGIYTASILNCVVTYKDDLETNINKYADGEQLSMDGEEREIITALEACLQMEKLKKRYER